MLVLCIHEIVASTPSTPWAVSEREVEATIGSYLDCGYVPATLDSLADGHERSLALTVDDCRGGAASWLLRRAPVFQIAATVFVVPGWIDHPLTVPETESYSGFAGWDTVLALRNAGHVIGSHGMTHVRLSEKEPKDVSYELRRSRERIAEVTGDEVRHFAAPYGSLTPAVVTRAKRTGYVTVCSTIPGENGVQERRSRVLKRWVVRSDRPNLGLPQAGIAREP